MITSRFSKLLLSATLGLGATFISTIEAKSATLFSANITGDQEVPPVITNAGGSANLILNEAQDQLSIDIQLFGVDIDGTQTPA